MRPKTRLLATLRAIALGAGIALGNSPALAQNQQTFDELCRWIDQQTDLSELQSIIDRLSQTDQDSIFDPTTGQNYSNACLTVAAEKLVELTATAGPGPDPDPGPY